VSGLYHGLQLVEPLFRALFPKRPTGRGFEVPGGRSILFRYYECRSIPTNAAIGGGALLSTVSKPQAPKTGPAPPEPDPYQYGWRYVRKTRPDGAEYLDEVPLTLVDVLHPELGDIILESDPHDSDRAYLKAVCKARLNDDLTAVVLSDCGVDWNIPGVKPLCPDLAVFLGARRQTGWTTFNVAKERARPALVVEVTSPKTRINDVGFKADYYHRAGVPLYVSADVSVEDYDQRQITLIGYERAPRRYKRIKPDKRGFIWLAPVRLWLGLTRDRLGGFFRLACFDPHTGEELGDYTAISQALAASERHRADAEVRAEAEERRANAEARARAEAEARIRKLEAELKRFRGRKS
jgi:colicin import membrane protein